MKKIIIIGTGGHAHASIDVIEQCDKYSIVGLIVKKGKLASTVFGYPVLGTDKETGITILDEDPEWYWHREAASGSTIELRLEKDNSYMMNIQQGDFELIDFELGGTESEITIYQSQ